MGTQMKRVHMWQGSISTACRTHARCAISTKDLDKRVRVCSRTRTLGDEMRTRGKAANKVTARASGAVEDMTLKNEDSESQLVYFYKYQGLGNDFIMIDNRHTDKPILSPDDSKALCDRKFGIGGDGVIFLLPPPKGTGENADYTMRIYNSDGSEPEMCGNGIRCLAQFLFELEGHDAPRKYNFHTLAGPIIPEVQANGLVSVDMGEPRLAASEVPTTLEPTEAKDAVVLQELEVGGEMDSIPDPEEMFLPYEERMAKTLDRRQPGNVRENWLVTCVSMGNPHCVTFGRPGEETLGGNLDLEALDSDYYGPIFESHEAFPEKINAHFCQTIYENPGSTDDLTDAVKVVHWERGAGKTLACGTGACAVVVAGVLEGRLKKKSVVYVPGGPLQIEWQRDTDNHVIMTGPAQLVYKGVLPA